MEKRNIPMPSDEFIQYMSRLTDANDHGRVYIKIADWCRKHYPRENLDWADVTSVFAMFCGMFKSMDNLHRKLGHFPFGSLRYEVGREMDEVIVDRFGKEVMEKLNEGGRS